MANQLNLMRNWTLNEVDVIHLKSLSISGRSLAWIVSESLNVSACAHMPAIQNSKN